MDPSREELGNWFATGELPPRRPFLGRTRMTVSLCCIVAKEAACRLPLGAARTAANIDQTWQRVGFFTSIPGGLRDKRAKRLHTHTTVQTSEEVTSAWQIGPKRLSHP